MLDLVYFIIHLVLVVYVAFAILAPFFLVWLFFDGPLFYRAYIRAVIGEPRNRFTYWGMVAYRFILIWPITYLQHLWPGKTWERVEKEIYTDPDPDNDPTE